MISAEYCRHLARYNNWQNNSLTAAADGLTATASIQVEQRAAGLGVTPSDVSLPSLGDEVSLEASVVEVSDAETILGGL